MKIHLTSAAYDFITEVTRSCEGEVGGMGYCHVEGSTIIVTHVFLLPQEVSAGSVEFDHDAIAIACERAAIADKIEELRFSWHSHGKMSTFWSNTDDKAIADYLSCGTPWMVSLVVNREGKMLGRVDVANVAIAGVAQFNDVKVDVEHIDPTNGRAKAEIAQYVREAPIRQFKGGRFKQNVQQFGGLPPANPRLHEISDTEWDKWYDSLGDSDGVFTG